MTRVPLTHKTLEKEIQVLAIKIKIIKDELEVINDSIRKEERKIEDAEETIHDTKIVIERQKEKYQNLTTQKNINLHEVGDVILHLSRWIGDDEVPKN